MSNLTDPLPPVPQHTPPVDETTGALKRFHRHWMQWFLQARDKINVINASLASLGLITEIGFLAKLTDGTWASRTISSPTDSIDVVGGDGSANVTVDLPETGVTPGTYGDATHSAVIQVDEYGRVVDIEEALISGGGGGGGGSGDTLTTVTLSSNAVTLDYSLGKYFQVTLDANLTGITVTDTAGPGTVTELELLIIQGGAAGGYTFTQPANFKRRGTADAQIPLVLGSRALMRIWTFDNGTTWFYDLQEIAGYGLRLDVTWGGADGSTTVVENSGKSGTFGGNGQVDTSLGYNSALFDGNDYCVFAASADFRPGTADFELTWDYVVTNKTGAQTQWGIGYTPTTGTGTGIFCQSGSGDGRCNIYQGTGTLLIGDTSRTVTVGVRYWMRLVRRDGNLTLYARPDGGTETVVGTVANSTNFASTGQFYIGGGSSVSATAFGFIGNIGPLKWVS